MPSKSKPAKMPAAQGAEAMGTALGEMMKSMAGIQFPAAAAGRIQSEYLQQAAQIWNTALSAGKPAEPIADRRFAGADWAANPASALTAQMYLLNARTMMEMADSIDADPKTRARIRFAVSQWVDAASPANYLPLNPDALRKAVESGGESIRAGVENLLADMNRGKVSQTDESAFEVGRNVATTEGSVVFENEVFQLIEYKPLTGQVYERPMLFVPPCINKFYIMDLQPDNSLIRWAVEQGHRLFVVSWRNPDASMAAMTWDDYIEQGPIVAIDKVREITTAGTLNMLGFCVGGTIVATALAVLAARGERPAHSLTLLTTLLDFSDTGILDVFVDEASVRLREMTIGADAPKGPGLLAGGELASTFSFLRPNDLVWNYVVGNYLKGESPPPFDLLYWNGDSTNLPGPMYCWYLRNTYLENKLKQPGALTVCGEKVDLRAIDLPTYVYGSREDHIVPWQSAHASLPMMGRGSRFVLGASGHIAGVINPASKNKRNYWTNGGAAPAAGAEAWFEGTTEIKGSWWNDWKVWLDAQGGRKISAPRSLGSRKHKPIEPAPGRYVKQKA